MGFIKSIGFTIKFFLFSTAFTPLIVLSNFPFPFVLGKTLFFRSVIEIALILFLFLIYLIFNLKNLQTYQLKNLFKNPFFISLSLFFISLIISAIFAVNPYRAFWGDFDRGEGLFGFLHFFAFLIMSAAIFETKDWLNFFKISLGGGLILIFYAFLQYFHIQNFPFVFNIGEPRPISLIGNPAFLATHMFFVMIFAVAVFFKTFNLFWRYFSLLAIFLSIATIFITATRGAILGLSAGILFLLIYFAIKNPTNLQRSETYKLINLRTISIALLGLIMILFGFFWLTRDAAIWQTIPGFNRLAKTAAFDINDSSTQMRLMNWKLSWNAFKEKPVFGWGMENYLIAYQKHYNPDYAVYGETWMDRAHNKIFDLLVMQGIFGLLAYLGIFGAAFYALFKKNGSITGGLMTKFIAAVLIGYFIQNLFVMDQIISDAMFFIVLGYLIFAIKNKSAQIENLQTYKLINLKTIIFGAISLILIIISGYSLYSYNYIPYVQAKIFNEAKGIERASLIEEKLKQAGQPYNFSQFNFRADIVDNFYNNQPHIFQDERFKPLADYFIKLIDEILQKEPYDARMFIRKTQMLQSMALNNPALYKEAEESMRKAIKISPTRQELYYNLAFALLGQEKFQEAVEISQKAIELSPNVARAHYHLAFVLAVIGPENKEEIIKEMEIADKLSLNFEGLMAGDHNIIALVYSRLSRPDKVAELMIKKINFGSPAKFLQVYYEEVLGYYAVVRDKDNFIKVAKDAISSNTNLKDDMEILIDLAEKGNWEIIDSLSK